MRKLRTPRPRVAGEREDEILEATLHLLLEVGYDRLTMDAVARRARASKATLYRRWESKPSLVVDAMVRAKQAPSPDEHDTGSLRGDLVSTFCGSHGLAHDATGLLGSVITALSSDPEFAQLFREAFIAPKVAASQAIYTRAIERGEIPADVDVDIIAPALAGILLHRSFVLGIVPDDADIERVIDHVILPAVGHPTAAVRTSGSTNQKDRTS
ncbi:MAG: TetR/AcrR family transcriptional regulator [Marmoricola sp.]|nr:TetR/AcrR family transcriptional regulator [Marmoricola sp.]MCW2837749.1 TetR/AcrR family transcriptional regulator [Marmoricola sp.]